MTFTRCAVSSSVCLPPVAFTRRSLEVLARHSTITLTMDNYTHLDVLDVAGALERLPAVPGTGPDRGQGAQKTGQAREDRHMIRAREKGRGDRL